MLSWLRTIPTGDAVRAVVADRYGLPVDSAVLLRSLANEVYEIGAGPRRYAFKLYHHGGWSLDEVCWEQDLVAYLRSSDIPCAATVPLADGSPAGELAAPEGPRPFALTRFVEGTTPQPPFTDELYADFGRLIGRFHAAAAGFGSDRWRRPFDLQEVLEQPLQQVLPHLAERRASVERLAAEARRRIEGSDAEWGIRHGDVSLDNIHRTDEGVVLHDFDLSGPGWLSADLTGVHSTEHWGAFAAGYREVRAVPDLDVLPWFTVCELIANLRFHLIDKPAYRGTESIREGWADRELTHLDELHRTLL